MGAAFVVQLHQHLAGGELGVGLDEIDGNVFAPDGFAQGCAVGIVAAAADDAAIRAQRGKVGEQIDGRAAEHFAGGQVVP